MEAALRTLEGVPLKGLDLRLEKVDAFRGTLRFFTSLAGAIVLNFDFGG
jgi:hypothetical protein